MKDIIKQLENIEWSLEKCNCDCCRTERLKDKEPELLLSVAPSLKIFPKIFDPQYPFNDSVATIRKSTERWTGTLRKLKKIELENQEIISKATKGEKLIFCTVCGLLYPQKQGIDHSLCPVCIRHYKFCSVCKELKVKRNFHRIYETQKTYVTAGLMQPTKETKLRFSWVCNECFKEHYEKCYKCGFKALKDVFIQIDQGVSGDLGFHPTGRVLTYICNTCEKQNRVFCHNCGKVTWNFVGELINNVYFCQVCTELRRPIHEFFYKPFKIHFHSGKKEGKVTDKALHFGFELEVERYYSALSRSAMAEIVKDTCGTDYVYIVHDGSIDRGIEIVSHPFTWEEYKENIDKWNDLLLLLRSKDWKANRPKVGFHVHMTKAAFTAFHLFKFLKFYYNSNNRNFINTVAQRKPNSYSTFSTADRLNIIANAKDKTNRDDTHYNAINLNNPTTIEVRIFRGTLEPLLFHKNIEFLEATFNFTRDRKPTEMNFKTFLNWLQLFNKQYVCLIEFLKMKGVFK